MPFFVFCYTHCCKVFCLIGIFSPLAYKVIIDIDMYLLPFYYLFSRCFVILLCSFCFFLCGLGSFSGDSDDKESACSVRDLGSVLGSRRSPGEGNGSPLQYSCLENPMDRGAWRATVHGVAELDMPERLTLCGLMILFSSMLIFLSFQFLCICCVLFFICDYHGVPICWPISSCFKLAVI